MTFKPILSLRCGDLEDDSDGGKLDASAAAFEDLIQLLVRLGARVATDEAQDVPGSLLEFRVRGFDVNHL
jgi:hypothetical protein